MAEDWARPVVHWELRAKDPERMRSFYAQMFNWEIGEGKNMRIPIGVGPPEGGPAGSIRKGETSGVVLYIQVRDLRESLDRAAQLGGKVTREAFDVPPGVTFAWIEDPEGNAVVLVQQ